MDAKKRNKKNDRTILVDNGTPYMVGIIVHTPFH